MPIATDRPIVIFDTSAVNAIYDDSERNNRMNLEDDKWTDRFHSFGDFMQFAFGDSGPYWVEAASHIKRALQIAAEEEESKDPNDVASIRKLKDAEAEITVSDAKRFAETCPPFKAHISGIACSAYSRVHDPSLNSKERARSAGRVDTFTTLYLPYCRHFVTNDDGEFDCHEKVASILGNGTGVYMYESFWKSLPTTEPAISR